MNSLTEIVWGLFVGPPLVGPSGPPIDFSTHLCHNGAE